MKPTKKRLVPVVLSSSLSLGLGILAATLAIAPAGVAAQNYSEQTGTVEVALNKSKVMQFGEAISKVSVGNPNVADIVVLRRQQLYILGKYLGTTNVLIWDKNSNLIEALDVSVGYDLNSLKQKLALLLPGERIEVYSSQGSIVLKGQVSSASNLSSALDVARSFVRTAREEQESQSSGDQESRSSGGQNNKKEDEIDNYIVNLLRVGGSQQVMLKVTVAELSRSTAKKLGVKFQSVNNRGNWTTGGVNNGTGSAPIIGPLFGELLPSALGIEGKGLFASYLNDDFLFSMSIEAAKENGTAKILAEPTLTALSGQSASFLSGGEFPIPVPNGNNNGTTIEFKDFGVGVKFMPVVLGNGAINLTLNVSVSELTDQNSVAIGDERTTSNFFIPSLTTRSTSTTIELADGQTIGIAGLIDEKMRSVVTKFPGLGDIPVLGQLFRSQAFERGESELVIMVTPYLAEPINNELTVLPTDSFVEPSDWRFYLLGKTYGTRRSSSTATDTRITAVDLPLSDANDQHNSGGVQGQFGHTIQ
jgi:pilus assembly protein CpaC